jgi:hypothetical protein
MKTHLIALTLFAVPTVAAAQPDTAPSLSVTEKSEPADSINVSPLGLVFGNVALTYEHLFNGTHGLIVEGYGNRESNDDGNSLQFGGGIGYRWHWRGKQNSGFLGVQVSQSMGTGEVVTDVGGTNEMRHAMSVRSTMVTGNIGKRWMLTDNVNITFRIGAGWGHHVATAKEDTQEAKDAEKLMNDILAFLPVGFDGELSLGYAF